VRHRTIQINHQPDATIFQFIILTFVCSSTCFGRFPAHHQELNDYSGSLWFYLRIVVIFVLCSWSGRPAGLDGTAVLSKPAHQTVTYIQWHIPDVVFIFFAVALQPNAGHGLLILEVPRSHNDAPQSVGLLWTSDQLVAETSTWKHTTLTTDKHSCPHWDSNLRSHRESGRRPTP
jgi:hypothetical protein